MGYVGRECQGWGEEEVSAVVQVEDKEVLETRTQEVRRAGRGV